MKQLVEDTAKIIIADNNSDRLFVLVAITGVAFIITMICCVIANKKRVMQLKQVRQKIEKRNQSIRFENEKRSRGIIRRGEKTDGGKYHFE